MRGYLLEGVEVRLCDDTALLGGAWMAGTNGLCYVSDRELIALAWTHLSRAAQPVLWDVGTSTGSFALLPVALSELHVYAFEPNQDVVPALMENLRLNGIVPQVTIRTLAISDHAGTLSFWCGRIGSNTGEGRCAPVSGWPSRQVEAAALDDLDLPAPTLIKMDIEGMELFALRGAAQTIQQYHPALILECSTALCPLYGYQVEDVTELLAAWGYHVEWPTNGNVFAWWSHE